MQISNLIAYIKRIILFGIVFLALGFNVFAEEVDIDFAKGTEYLKEGKWNDAVVEFQKTLNLNQQNVGALFNLGCAYALIDNYPEAIKQFEKALSLETQPYRALCYFNLAGVYLKQAFVNYEASSFKESCMYFNKAKENFLATTRTLPLYQTPIDFANGAKTMSNITVRAFDFKCAIKKEVYYPDSCTFVSTDKVAGDDSYVFSGTTVPVLFFWRSFAVDGVIGINYALSKKYQEADTFLNSAFEKISLEIAESSRLITIQSIICPRKGTFGVARDEAITALLGFLNMDYEKAGYFAKSALLKNPEDKIAKNVIIALEKQSKKN